MVIVKVCLNELIRIYILTSFLMHNLRPKISPQNPKNNLLPSEYEKALSFFDFYDSPAFLQKG